MPWNCKKHTSNFCRIPRGSKEKKLHPCSLQVISSKLCTEINPVLFDKDVTIEDIKDEIDRSKIDQQQLSLETIDNKNILKICGQREKPLCICSDEKEDQLYSFNFEEPEDTSFDFERPMQLDVYQQKELIKAASKKETQNSSLPKSPVSVNVLDKIDTKSLIQLNGEECEKKTLKYCRKLINKSYYSLLKQEFYISKRQGSKQKKTGKRLEAKYHRTKETVNNQTLNFETKEYKAIPSKDIILNLENTELNNAFKSRCNSKDILTELCENKNNLICNYSQNIGESRQAKMQLPYVSSHIYGKDQKSEAISTKSSLINLKVTNFIRRKRLENSPYK